jgi:serine/threonine protein kinase
MAEQTQQLTSTLVAEDTRDEIKAAESEYWAFALSTSDPPLPEKLHTIFFKDDEIVFGRKKTSHVALDHAGISSVHCRLRRDPHSADEFIVRDESGTNGTFVNKKCIGRGNEVRIKAGQEIVLLRAPDQRVSYCIQALGSTAPAETQPYLIRQTLGAGAYATVRECVHSETGVRRAMKIIDVAKFVKLTAKGGNDAQRDSAALEGQLSAEFDLLHKLAHPNIITVHDHFFQTGQDGRRTYCIVMDLLEHGDLLDFMLARNRPLSEPEARRVFIQLINATEYLHGNDIVHRDIKPENILVSSREPLTVKLTDFGLSRIMDTRGFLTTVCGTPQYLAPEVLRISHYVPAEHRAQEPAEGAPGASGAAGYGKAVDYWSLGVILYIMLALAQPFDDNNLVNTIVTGQFSFPPDVWGGYDPSVQDLIRGLLTTDPTHRLDGAAVRRHPWVLADLTPAERADLAAAGAPPAAAAAAAPAATATAAGAAVDRGTSDATGITAPMPRGAAADSAAAAPVPAAAAALDADAGAPRPPGGAPVSGIVYRMRTGAAMTDDEPTSSQLVPLHPDDVMLPAPRPAPGPVSVPVPVSTQHQQLASSLADQRSPQVKRGRESAGTAGTAPGAGAGVDAGDSGSHDADALEAEHAKRGRF